MIAVYQTGDAECILPQAMQVEEAADFASCFDEIEAYSLIDENSGMVTAVFGYRVCDDKAECFALLGDNVCYQLREMLVFLKKLIPEKMAELGLKCVYATIKKGFAAGVKFAEMLGFHWTADLPNFYLGCDYQLFERREI